MEQKELSGGVVLLRAGEGMVLRRKGGDAFPGHRSVTARVADVELYEEVCADEVSPFSRADYEATVAAMVRERYTADEEFALQRKLLNELTAGGVAVASAPSAGDDVPAALREFAEYNAFVEQCKAEAPERMARERAVNDDNES